MPVLNWDSTATGPDEAAALADFEANRDAAIADYAAQIEAMLARTNSGPITTSFGCDPVDGEVLRLYQNYIPDPNTTLTYGDLFDLYQDADGRASLMVDPRTEFNTGLLFDPSDAIKVVMTAFDDEFITFQGFAGPSIWLDMVAGNDIAALFYPFAPDLPLPDSVTVLGGAGNDEVILFDGVASHLHCGDGQDTNTGGTLADVVSGDAGDDTLNGGTGRDTLYGGTGNDLLEGGDQNDRLAGGAGNDTLLGGAARDRMLGGGGDDRITGGTGNDFITGGNGADAFVFAAGDGRDRVTDQTLKDRIELEASLWAGSVADFVAARVTGDRPDQLRMATTAKDFVVFDTTLTALT